MKKLLACVLSLFMLTACSSGSSSDKKETTKASSNNEYTFKVKDTTLAMNQEINETELKKLGDYQYFEAKSCAFEGKDKTYTYSSFVVKTYPTNDKDYIASVSLKDDTISTQEGISIASSKDDVVKKYGKNYKENNGNLTYTKGKSQLQFIMEDDAVSAINYVAITPAK